MNFKMLKAIKNKSGLFIQTRNYISALYVSRNKASEQYAVLTPYMEFESVLKEDFLQKNCNLRKVSCDVNELKKEYINYKTLQCSIQELESRRRDIAKIIKNHQEDDESLKKEGKTIRDKIKNLKQKFYVVEEHFIKKFLQLPNVIHEKTPKDFPSIIYRKGISNDSGVINKTLHHLNSNQLIDFVDETRYYLLGDAARFSWDFSYNCGKLLLENNFIVTVNPDFGRSLLIEGALLDKKQVFNVKEENCDIINGLHLTGGGSLIGFLGCITKLSVFPNALPLKLFSSGRFYQKPKEKANFTGLYNASQSNIISTFVATETLEQADNELENILNLVVDIYKKLDVDFRIEFLPAHSLSFAESLRASIQIFSPAYSKHIEVGYVSNFKDFISKRLLFNSKRDGKVIFPNIISGAIVNVTKIIACLLENEKRLNSTSDFNKCEIQSFKDFIS